MLIHNKDDIEFVTEFPCFLGHPVDEVGGGWIPFDFALRDEIGECDTCRGWTRHVC